MIAHIQSKIKSLKHELNAIQYTVKIENITTETDNARMNECIHKIQVFNEILISYGIQDKSKKK